MWARVKGETENALLALPFKAAYMFRPGYIQPMRGVRSSTRWYQAVYDVDRTLVSAAAPPVAGRRDQHRDAGPGAAPGVR